MSKAGEFSRINCELKNKETKLSKYKKIIKSWKKITPGVITGGADNDPSGIATYSISGALFGYSQLWIMVLATPMLIAVQSMCSRLGNIKREGLTSMLRENFSPWIAWLAAVIVIIANVATIGADILAMSEAASLITHIGAKFWLLPITIGIWYIVLFKNYKVLSRLLLVMVLFFLAYIGAAVLAKPDWGQVLQNSFFPNLFGLPANYFVAAVGILGTTITPYLFFWQVKEEVEEKKTKKEAMNEAAHEDRINSPGFIFSQIIALFIMIATAATLHVRGVEITSAADAARALSPVAGNWASLLFSIGILGAGILALPILAASTAYVVAEAGRFKHESLNDKVKNARGFYTVITLSLLSGVGMLILGINPISALYYSQVLAGILAPFLLILILILTNRKSVIGEFRNGWFDNFFGTLAILVMFAASILMFVG